MKMKQADWNDPPKEVIETITDARNYFYGGLSCDVWVYSWVMMENEPPEWLKEINDTIQNSDAKVLDGIMKILNESVIVKGDEYMVIMKERGVSLSEYNISGEALLTSPMFEWGIADNVESARAVIKADQRLQQSLLDIIGDENALAKGN